MDTLTKFGFKQCRVGHAVLFRFDQDATILVIDIGDITIVGNFHKAVQRFKDELSSRYGIKDMGNLCWLLGIRIDWDCENQIISFSQAAYLHKIVECLRMEDANLLSIPIAPSHNLSKLQLPVSDSDIEEMRQVPYRETIASLMYAVVGT